MATFPYDCPHCGSKKIGFTVLGNSSIARANIARANSNFHPPPHAWFAHCNNGKCNMPVIAIASRDTGEAPDPNEITAFYPAPPKPDIPDHIPENAKQFYEQAENNIPQNPDAAGAMYRKVLDVALKFEFPDSPDNLAARIKKLVEDGVLTKALGDFSHHVRLGGNNAVHDTKPFTVKEAEELQFFTRMVMTYVFTLPTMIRLKQPPPDDGQEEK